MHKDCLLSHGCVISHAIVNRRNLGIIVGYQHNSGRREMVLHCERQLFLRWCCQQGRQHDGEIWSHSPRCFARLARHKSTLCPATHHANVVGIEMPHARTIAYDLHGIVDISHALGVVEHKESDASLREIDGHVAFFGCKHHRMGRRPAIEHSTS